MLIIFHLTASAYFYIDIKTILMKLYILPALIIITLGSCNGDTERVKPIVSSITESVYASAKIKAQGQYEVYSLVNGILEKILVKPGDTIEQGQPLFILDDRNAPLNAASAELAYSMSMQDNSVHSAKFEEAKLNVKQAKDKYLLDSSLYIRQANLWKEQIGSQLELDQRRLSFLNSKNNYHTTLNKLHQLKTDLENRQKQAGISYHISKNQQNDYVIRSAFKGKVFDVFKELGELIGPQTPLAIIGDSHRYILEMSVDEYDIIKIRPGQQVEITMDSYEGKVFQGVVEKIYPIIDERLRTFRVDARFIDQPEALYPNLTAEANIVINTKDNTMLIPKEYLVENKFVWISEKKKKQVEVGLSDYKMVEIIKGLDSAQFIYKPH